MADKTAFPLSTSRPAISILLSSERARLRTFCCHANQFAAGGLQVYRMGHTPFQDYTIWKGPIPIPVQALTYA